MPYQDYKFLQIYFVGNSARAHNSVKRYLVEQLQTFFYQHNEFVALFTTALDRIPSDNYKIVIRANKAPAGQHAGRFNVPTIDEVAIVVVGENLENRDIVLYRRNDHMMPYNILSYFGNLHFSMKMISSVTGKLLTICLLH